MFFHTPEAISLSFGYVNSCAYWYAIFKAVDRRDLHETNKMRQKRSDTNFSTSSIISEKVMFQSLNKSRNFSFIDSDTITCTCSPLTDGSFQKSNCKRSAAWVESPAFLWLRNTRPAVQKTVLLTPFLRYFIFLYLWRTVENNYELNYWPIEQNVVFVRDETH